jgi:hypothetical protein
MNNAPWAKDVAAPKESRLFLAAVGLAVVLSLVCCALILLIPTESTSVDTVYQGF